MNADAGGDVERAIAAGAAELGQALPEGAAARLAHLVSELERWNARVNLTAVRGRGAMVTHHVLDSLSVRGLLKGPRLVDAGTGAGFPGLPLAVAEPGHDVTLVDSNRRKIGFVRHMIGELGLSNASAVRARIESYAPRSRFDTVISRAFAPLARTAALVAHLLGDAGVILALKGKYPAAELAEIEAEGQPWDIEVTELTVPGLEQHARHAVTLARPRERRT